MPAPQACSLSFTTLFHFSVQSNCRYRTSATLSWPTLADPCNIHILFLISVKNKITNSKTLVELESKMILCQLYSNQTNNNRRHTKLSHSPYPHLPRKTEKKGNKWRKNRDVEPRRKINTSADINIFSETQVLDPRTI